MEDNDESSFRHHYSGKDGGHLQCCLVSVKKPLKPLGTCYNTAMDRHYYPVSLPIPTKARKVALGSSGALWMSVFTNVSNPRASFGDWLNTELNMTKWGHADSYCCCLRSCTILLGIEIWRWIALQILWSLSSWTDSWQTVWDTVKPSLITYRTDTDFGAAGMLISYWEWGDYKPSNRL